MPSRRHNLNILSKTICSLIPRARRIHGNYFEIYTIFNGNAISEWRHHHEKDETGRRCLLPFKPNGTKSGLLENTWQFRPKIVIIYVECDLDALSSVYIIFRVCLFGIRNNTSFGRTSTTSFERFDDVFVAAFKLSFPFLVHLISHSVMWKLKMFSGRLRRRMRRRRWHCSERSQHFHVSDSHGPDRAGEEELERKRKGELVYLFVTKFLCFLYYSCDDDLQWRRSSDWITSRQDTHNRGQAEKRVAERKRLRLFVNFFGPFCIDQHCPNMFVENQHSVHQFEMHSHVSKRMRTQAVNLEWSCAMHMHVVSRTFLDLYAATVEKQVHRASSTIVWNV